MRTKLVALLAGFVFGTMIVCVMLNSMFLGNYYWSSKEAGFHTVYQKLNKIESFTNMDEETQRMLATTCETNSISLTIIDTAWQSKFMIGSLYLQNYMQELIRSNIQLAEKQDTVNTIKDRKSGDYYLEMHGALKDNSFYIMCVSVSNIEQSVGISNRFFIYISIISMLCSICFMWVVSRQFTKPLMRLVAISERMCKLDFNAKYEPTKYADEIDMLGNSMNNLSDKLEHTILNLKKANLELQKDIDQKTEVDNMRKDFISNVSHELKTPIALIQGYSEGLKEGITDGDKDSMDFYCDVIIDEANRMNKMVRNLLALNQLEYGNTPLEMSRFDIVSVIDGVLHTIRLLIEQKEAKILFDRSKSVMVWGDEFQIEQVITNYVNNALNHLEGEHLIKIWLEERENSVIRVNVFNTGKQIPKEDIDKIWIKFYKVDKARTREYGGNGIGLSIVKAIMEQHKKECGVENEEEGVRFWFEVDAKTE